LGYTERLLEEPGKLERAANVLEGEGDLAAEVGA
jgi:hypothetical protein